MIEYRRTFGGMIQANIRLMNKSTPNSTMFTSQPFLRRKLALVEAEKNRKLDDDNVHSWGFPNSYLYADPTDPIYKVIFIPEEMYLP